MSAVGYYMLTKDLARWLDAAQSAQFTKNKVRKDLWSNFTECIRYSLPSQQTGLYTRIHRAHFITLQSFCMLEGKGDKLNNDELLSFITTLDDLRFSCTVSELALEHEQEQEDDDSEEERPVTSLPKTAEKKRRGSV